MDEIRKQIVYLDESKGVNDLFAGEALKIIGYDINSYEQWSKWKHSALINDIKDGKVWKLDPQVVEEKCSNDFYLLMRRSFHKEPFSALVMVAWFFIKQNELDNIRTATEAIRLNVQLEQAV